MPKGNESDNKPPAELVDMHTFAAGDGIRATDVRGTERRLLDILPDDVEEIYDVYNSEGDLREGRAAKEGRRLDEDSSDEGEEQDDADSEVDDGELVEDDEPEEDPDDGEVEEDEEDEEFEDEEPADPAEIPGDTVFRVKVDGEEKEVTLDELRSGFSFRDHNTRVSQKLAAERKAFEQEVVSVRQERQQYGQRLAEVDEFLTRTLPQEPDWAKLEKENPAKFAAEYAKFERRKQEIAAVRAERQKVAEQQVADMQQAYQQRLAEESEKLMAAIPEWSDPDVRQSEHREMIEFLVGLGFSAEEAQATDDHRMVLLIRDAKRYRDLKTRGKDVVAGKKKRKPSKTALKPGSKARRTQGRKTSAQAKDARKRLAETGRFDAMSDYLLDSDLLD